MSNRPKPSSQRPSPLKSAGRHLKGILLSPYGVAAIASLSFHGVLFAAVPRFSSVSFAAFDEENLNAETRTVPLVTLSPAEQGRLPNFNRSQLPAIPNITGNTALSTLPNSTIFNRSTFNGSTFNRSSSSRTTNPSTRSSSSLNRNRPFRNPYIPRPDFQIRNTPTQSEQSRARQNQQIEVPTTPTVVDVDTLKSDTDEDILRRQQEIEERQAAEANQTAEASSGLPELPPQGAEDVTDPDENSEQAAAQEQDIAANPELSPQQAQLARLLDTLAYDEQAANISPEDVEANYEAWATDTDQASETAIEDVTEKGELPVAMGSNLCLDNAPQAGEVAVLVAPDGTPSNPVLLRSTGYDQPNQAALNRLLNQDYPAAETVLRYRFNVIVEDYDADTCTRGEDLQETAQEAQ